ncbi:hypothetical protein [Leptospira meyeri]|nr:hypothetical protein [Leptospira meyeri]
MNNYKNNLITKSTSIMIDASDLALVEIIKRIAENQNVLKDIPVIKWAFTSYEIYNNFQIAHFIKKYANFLGPISEDFIDDEEINLKLKECIDDEKKIEKLIEYTIISITNYQTDFKAKILGRLFVKTFKSQIFTPEEYNILLFSIENIHPITGFPLLEKYYSYYINYKSENNIESKNHLLIEIANLDYYPLSTSGLVNLPRGGAYAGDVGGAFISSLGIKFFENCILNY